MTGEELKDAVWGDRAFVDFERGLNFCIAQVRSALCPCSSSRKCCCGRQGMLFGRPLFHLGGLSFYPAGAAAVRVAFARENENGAMVMTVRDADVMMRARRDT